MCKVVVGTTLCDLFGQMQIIFGLITVNRFSKLADK